LKKPNETMIETNMNLIINFLDQNKSLTYFLSGTHLSVKQAEDQKTIIIDLDAVEKVLQRVDVDGAEFIQINFKNLTKILMTKTLVGFKPTEVVGFDSHKIPKVVTTVDLKSIILAIEELYEAEESYSTLTEIEVLKKVFQSILSGAECVGFDMKPEKEWFFRYLLNHSAASA
jgi:hypothetical protein